jgi:RES domain-containing protein
MYLYRLSLGLYAADLSGKGASIRGGRWNSQGLSMLYTSANRSLAMAEVAVHLSIGTLPGDYFMLSLEIPDDLAMEKIEPEQLSPAWNLFPNLLETQMLGDDFLFRQPCCMLRVPSAVTQGDFNYLFNPAHPDFQQLKLLSIEPFPFDRRLFKA